MLQNTPYPTSIILFFIFTLVIVFSMIILLLIMVSVSVTCNDSEEKLTSNMEQNQDEVAGDQVEFILADLHNAVSSQTGTQFYYYITFNTTDLPNYFHSFDIYFIFSRTKGCF